MNGIKKRLLAMLLCVSMLATCLPAVSEEITDQEVAEITVTAESSAEPQAEAPAVQEDTAIPEAVETVAEEPAEAEESAVPTVSAEPEKSAEEETAEEEPDTSAAADSIVSDMIAAMREENVSGDLTKAEWLYRELINIANPGEGVTAYDALSGAGANSKGYADAYSKLLSAADIDSRIVTGNNGSVWNIVKIGGQWTHIDAYTDDANSCLGKDFGLSDAAMGMTRTWIEDDLPSCTDSTLNYYVRYCEYICVTSEADMHAIIDEDKSARIYNANALPLQEIVDAYGVVGYVVESKGCYAVITAADLSEKEIAQANANASIEIDAESYTICVGDECRISYTTIPTNAVASFYTTSSAICTVSDKGVITARKTGTATVTVSINGAAKSVPVTVIGGPTAIAGKTPRYNASARTIRLGVGEEIQLDYSTTPAAAKDYAKVSYSSGNNKIATISSTGVLKGVTAGATTVTLKCYNGISVTASVTVVPAPTDIAIVHPERTLGLGESSVCQAVLVGDSYGIFAPKFTSSDSEIVSVNESTGLMTAVAYGSATITATSYNKKSATCKVTVKTAPESVSISGNYTTIAVGEQLQLSSMLLPEESSGAITWYTSASNIASVDEDGLVTGRAAGTVTITAATYNGVSNTYMITVKPNATRVMLNVPSKQIGISETMQTSYTLVNYTNYFTYTTSDSSVVTIDENGLIKGIAEGSAYVNLKAGNVYSGNILIEVKAAPESVTASAHELTIAAGDTKALYATLSENSASVISYASDNTEVATVSENGTVTAVAPGTAKITLSTYNGKNDSCEVTVLEAPTSLALTASHTVVGLKEFMFLEPVFAPVDVDAAVTFSSSNSKVVAVNNSGLIYAKKKGSATIYVRSYNGLVASIRITVKNAPKSMRFFASRTVLGLGETAFTSYSFNSGAAGSVSRYDISPSDDPSIKIDEKGNITTLHAGRTAVRAVSYNGKGSNVITFTVTEAPSSITATVPEATIGVGATAQLGYTLNDGTAGAVTYSSNDTSICEVNATTGVVTARAIGETEVTMTTYNGVSTTSKIIVVPAPESIAFVNCRTTIGLKEYYQLTTSILPEGSATNYVFRSSKSSVVAVSQSGLIYGKKKGSAIIRVYTHNGLVAAIKITVKKAPTGASLNVPIRTLGLGETVQTYASYSSGSAGSMKRYETADANIVTIDENGLITATGVGSTVVRAITYNNKATRVVGITVVDAPTSITPNADSLTIGVGDSRRLGYTLSEGSASQVTFTSSDETIATVNASTGDIKAVGEGTCIITAKTYNNIEAKCSVTVVPAPTSLTITNAKYTMGLGESYPLNVVLAPEDTASGITYITSNGNYATVSADGVIYARRTGTVYIKAQAYNGAAQVLKISIVAAPSAVSLSRKEFTVGAGESVDLQSYVSITARTSTVFTYTSADPAICSVSESGVFTGNEPGFTTITVTTHNGKTATCTVNVLRAPTSVSLEAPSEMGVGQKCQSIVTIGPNDTEYAAFERKFEVIEGDSVSVSSDGVITALSAGQSVVRVSTYLEDVYADQEITVRPAPTSLTFPQTEYSVMIDDKLQLTPIIDNGATTQYTYSITKAGYFTIDESGLLTPISRGTTTVTVSTHNGIKAVLTITIVDPYFPESISWTVVDDNPPVYMAISDDLDYPKTWTPQIEVTPSTAKAGMVWTSSNPSVLEYNESTGTFIAKAYGSAVVKGTSTRNPSLTLSANITVFSNYAPALTLPLQYGSIAGWSSSQVESAISANRVKVYAIRDSAYYEIDALKANGQISSTEASKRKTIVDRAFDMLDLPWTTSKNVAYWTSSYDGAPFYHSKDYKTNVLYCGIPYTQTNRKFNKSKLISNGWYTGPSGSVYNLNTSKFTGRNYAGNDCSSFVSQAVIGGSCYDNTTSIAESSSYTTLNKTTYGKSMRPGDILVNSGHHVVMFLYYTNPERTQFMIIEQGGSDDYHNNVVACRIKDNSAYNKYTLRRPKL